MLKTMMLYLVSSLLYANHDPFHAKVHVQKIKAHVLQMRSQYLGCLEHQEQTYGFIRQVGSDVIRVVLGKNIGFAKVSLIQAQKICIEKQAKVYCLPRSTQLLNWQESRL